MKYVREIKGNLLEFPEGIEIAVHCANCFCAMGGGIAAQIAQQFPEARDADDGTKKGDESKLGTFSWAKLNISTKDYPKFIANVYGQFTPSTAQRAVNYEAIAQGIEKVMIAASGTKRRTSKKYKVGFPKRMGSDLAGGDWAIIEAMIKTYAEKYGVETIIVDFEK